MVNNTPQINATGLYTLISPFNIDESMIYRCESIAGFEALELKGEDVYETYYESNTLPLAKFKEDELEGVNIVTLMSTTGGPTIYVPSSYILKMPSSGAVAYNRMIISIDLGLLPDNVSLSATIAELKNVASDLIGVEPIMNTNRVPVKGGVDNEKHTVLETNRLRAIKYRKSPYADSKRLAKIVEQKNSQIALLEEALISLA